MKSRKESLLNLVAQESDYLKRLGVKEIGLYGSVVRGEDSAGSDIDILVVFEKHSKNFKNFIALIDFLEDRLGCSVDLVTRESLSPYLGPHILDEVEYVPLAS